jgi:predicted metal-dependent phosphotriesterase family hydrolase
MHKHVIPELEKMGVSQDAIEMLFVENPRRFFGG